MSSDMQTDEVVLIETSPAMFRNHPFLFILSAILCLVGIGIIIMIVWYIRSRSTELTITNFRTSLHRGWLSRSVTEVWHSDVRNVQLDQTFFQRVLGTGRIAVSSAGQSGIEIDVNGLPDPDELKALIDKHRVLAREDEDENGD